MLLNKVFYILFKFEKQTHLSIFGYFLLRIKMLYIQIPVHVSVKYILVYYRNYFLWLVSIARVNFFSKMVRRLLILTKQKYICHWNIIYEI